MRIIIATSNSVLQTYYLIPASIFPTKSIYNSNKMFII